MAAIMESNENLRPVMVEVVGRVADVYDGSGDAPAELTNTEHTTLSTTAKVEKTRVSKKTNLLGFTKFWVSWVKSVL